MKGIILAGGNGTRLYPLTKVINKQLLPVYDKPMIYYPLSILMLAGIREILIISSPEFLPYYRKLFANGADLGLKLEYAEQQKPNGLAESFIIGRKFVGSDNVALILGDNIFFGQGISKLLKNACEQPIGANIFAYWVADPRPYGVAVLDEHKKVIGLEEKPEKPQSNWAVTGLYFYDNQVLEIAKNLERSKRGEFEITDINKTYLEKGQLHVNFMGRGYAWLDTGTHEALLQASQFVETIESRQGFKIACIEEIALRMGFISLAKFKKISNQMSPSAYNEYLKKIINEFESQTNKH